MPKKRTALILAAVMAFMVLAVPLFSEEAEGTLPPTVPATPPADTIVFSSDVPAGSTITMRAGETHVVHIIVYNPGPDKLRVQLLDVSFSRGGMNSVSVDPSLRLLEAGEDTVFDIPLTAGGYTGTVDLTAYFTFAVIDPTDGSRGEFKGELSVKISSRLASENQYNRIMGIWNNPLPEPFDQAMYATAITFIIWFLIAALVAWIIFPRIIMGILFKRKNKDDRKAVERKIRKPLMIIIMLYGITICLAVLGVGEYVISTVSIIANVIYIILIAWILLKLYIALLDMWEKRAHEDGVDDVRDSIKPLLLMLGKIIIAMAATAGILGAMGFSLMIIATGAGIIGLAISFGAQSTLAQFFGGITLLVNRPFRPGDLIRLDNNTETLRVINVGFMMTTFRNWANSEIFTMPNQKVVSSTIINVTAESLAFRIIVLVRVPYGTDVALAKKLALEAMTEHPRILQDGSEEIPKVRLEEFSESSLLIRVSGFVDDFEDHRSIAGEIREAIYTKYRDNNVTIAIPKMDIYVKDPNDKEEKY